MIVVLISYGVWGADMPAADAPANEWASWYDANTGSIQAGLVIWGVGLVLALWFIGSLRAAIGAAEGSLGRLSNIAYGGGLIAVAGSMLFISALLAAALRAGEADPAVTQALNDFSYTYLGGTNAGYIAFYGATAVAIYRNGGPSRTYAVVLAVAAFLGLFGYGVAVQDSGTLSAEGLFGWLDTLSVIGTLALAVALIRAPATESAG